jgi:hypothetical protein
MINDRQQTIFCKFYVGVNVVAKKGIGYCFFNSAVDTMRFGVD